MIILKKNKIDEILVTGPPFSQFIVGYLLAKIFRKKLINRLPGSLVFLSSFTSGLKKTSLRYKFNFWLEKEILSKADRIILNTNHSKKRILQSFFLY